MGFGQIQFGGLASGLDTNAIIGALLASEQRPISILESRRDGERQKITRFNELEDLVEKLRDAARDLNDTGSFFAYTSTVADESVASVSLTGTSALTGTHTLEVEQLAAADRYAITGIGAGTLDFTYDGEAYSITVGATDTMADVAASINSATDGKVNASVVNTGTAASPNEQLVISGGQTGEDFAITGLGASSAITGTLDTLTSAQNAIFTVDGLDIVRSSNVVSDVLDGVSFTLNSAGGIDTPVTTNFGIEADLDGTKENVQGLVDAYNEVLSFINGQSNFSSEGGASGILFGDRALQEVRTTLRGALTPDPAAVANGDGFASLGLIGVEINSDGLLEIDEETFNEKIEQDAQAVASLFTTNDTGVLDVLDDAIDVLLNGPIDPVTGERFTAGDDTVDGVFDRRRDTLNRSIRRMESDIERLENNLGRFEESLIRRFANLEQIVGGLNAQQSFLNSGLAFPR